MCKYVALSVLHSVILKIVFSLAVQETSLRLGKCCLLVSFFRPSKQLKMITDEYHRAAAADASYDSQLARIVTGNKKRLLSETAANLGKVRQI